MTSLYKKVLFSSYIVLSLSSLCFGQSFPSPKGYVNDYVGVIRPQYINYLSSISRKIDVSAKTQIVTVVVETLGGISIEEYSNRLFEQWRIGYKGSDQGVLLLLALKEKKARIEVGYGLEAILPDSKSGFILDQYVISHFNTGDYEKGISSGHMAISKVVAKAFQIPLNSDGHYTQTTAPQATALNHVSSIILLGGIIIMMSTRKGRQMLPWILLLMMGSSRGYRSSGFGSFGNSGFGGFGGGMSGGGGSSRSW